MYPVITEPPVAGAVQVTMTVLATVSGEPETTDVSTTWPGTVAGVRLAEEADDAPVPCAVTARTRKLYAVPLVRPVTV